MFSMTNRKLMCHLFSPGSVRYLTRSRYLSLEGGTRNELYRKTCTSLGGVSLLHLAREYLSTMLNWRVLSQTMGITLACSFQKHLHCHEGFISKLTSSSHVFLSSDYQVLFLLHLSDLILLQKQQLSSGGKKKFLLEEDHLKIIKMSKLQDKLRSPFWVFAGWLVSWMVGWWYTKQKGE